ncbi:hypothetical protein ACWFPY_34855 [Nocardia fluminea]
MARKQLREPPFYAPVVRSTDTVVHPQHFRRPADRNETLLELGDEPVGGDRAFSRVQQQFSRVFIDHRRDLHRPPINSGIELKI